MNLVQRLLARATHRAQRYTGPRPEHPLPVAGDPRHLRGPRRFRQSSLGVGQKPSRWWVSGKRLRRFLQGLQRPRRCPVDRQYTRQRPLASEVGGYQCLACGHAFDAQNRLIVTRQEAALGPDASWQDRQRVARQKRALLRKLGQREVR